MIIYLISSLEINDNHPSNKRARREITVKLYFWRIWIFSSRKGIYLNTIKLNVVESTYPMK